MLCLKVLTTLFGYIIYMIQKLLINVGLICVISIGGAAYLTYKHAHPDSYDARFESVEKKLREEASPTVTARRTVAKKTMPPRKSGSTVSLRKDPRNGHFWANAKVNTGSVHFLVDTGASSVALTLNDAKKAGIKVRNLKFNVPVSTAGGTNYGAYIKLERVSVGAITIRDVDALIIKDGLTTSLLGMSYLGELQKVEATRDTLFLRL